MTEFTASAPALTAFLKGVERRADVLASLQCGDPDLANRALAATFRAFQTRAGEWPMAVWPTRFWALLAATPALREPSRTPHWPTGLAALAPLAAEDRLALLLRIVVGLDETVAADVLGVEETAYRQALARACPRDAAGHPDAQEWRALAEAAQRELREVAPDRLAHLAELRDQAVRTVAVAAAPVPVDRDNGRRRERRAGPARRLPRWALPAIVLLALAAATSWWATHRQATRLPPEPVSQAPEGVLHVTDAAPVVVEELPADDLEAAAPVPPGDPADAAMLADPDLALARQADFYAWFAAGGPIPPDESEPRPTAPDLAAAGLETTTDDE
ncbi:MAG TPA: hypothetical protein VM687_03430 [Stenotrophomonas sp.]|nr:hypothetical protein [Stenotrophomonas sp.]